MARHLCEIAICLTNAKAGDELQRTIDGLARLEEDLPWNPEIKEAHEAAKYVMDHIATCGLQWVDRDFIDDGENHRKADDYPLTEEDQSGFALTEEDKRENQAKRDAAKAKRDSEVKDDDHGAERGGDPLRGA